MRNLRLALFTLLALFALSAPAAAKRKKKKSNKVTQAQLLKLRKAASKDASLRKALTRNKKSSMMALRRFIGRKAARKAVVYAERPAATQRRQGKAATRSRGGATGNSMTISIQIPPELIPSGGVPAPDAPGAFCLADPQDTGSWECTDEEVAVTSAGKVRGRTGK